MVKQSNKFSSLLEILQDEDYVEMKWKEKIIDSYVEKISKNIHQDEKIVLMFQIPPAPICLI